MAIRIGIICPSNIAYRRFLPALKQCDSFEYVGVAYAAPDEWFGGQALPEIIEGECKKAESFAETYGGEVISGYAALLNRKDVDAIYLPLPPALHYRWGKRVLESGKHLFMEKPFTARLADTEELLDLARSQGLAVHENYMFIYHRQIREIQKLIASGEIGDVRLVRASFGFPFRGTNDFRYNKELGGGALLDCGGYPIRLARLLLGDSAQLVEGYLHEDRQFGVDIYGSAVLRNDSGTTAQISFGMDNAYQCKVEVWGSKALLVADRVFTPPADFSPKLTLQDNNGMRIVEVEPDDQFRNSIGVFEKNIKEFSYRESRFKDILNQAEAVEKLQHRCLRQLNVLGGG